MDRRKLEFLVIICIILGSASGIQAYLYYNPIFLEKRDPQRLFWLSALFTENALEVVRNYPNIIDMISPNWYTLQADGSIKNTRLEEAGSIEIQNVLDNCSFYGIPIHPLVSASSTENIRLLLENPENQQRFFTSLNAEMTLYNYAGINIDLEGIPADLRDEFNSFFQDLRNNLIAGKILSIDVPAKEYDDKNGWAGWCDYQTIGQFADLIMIMTYDLHGGWTEPGEVASISWVKRVMAYAIKTIPLPKIFAGIPLYGYDWSEDPTWQNWGFGYEFFSSRFEMYGGTRTRTTDGYEICYKYIDGNGFKHTAYYCDATTTLKKEQFLSRYPIGGYCYWHIGCGDPEYYPAI